MKSLLVQLDGSARCGLRLKVAAEIARRHGAQLTALFAAPRPLLTMPFAYTGDAAVAEVLQQLYDGWLERSRQTFGDAAPGPTARWAELGPVPLIPGFAAQAQLADLTVLGQHDPDDRDGAPPADFVPSVLAASGRAALVLPYAGRCDTVGSKVLVAWKPAAASARALAAALPLLREAAEVTVVAWGSAPDPDAPLDVGRYLAWHGVRASLQQHTDAPSELGELLLSRAADLGADLLVMGAYGHSRAREWVLGGVTRTVLQSMTLPVLMSH
ncbi:MAG TPA: universal stress protein [Methylibium sp.]|nr:universal stress protein [Methylibium sp.]